MTKLYRDLGNRMLTALIGQRAASAGCAPDCEKMPCRYGDQFCFKTCCFTPNCNWVCQG